MVGKNSRVFLVFQKFQDLVWLDKTLLRQIGYLVDFESGSTWRQYEALATVLCAPLTLCVGQHACAHWNELLKHHNVYNTILYFYHAVHGDRKILQFVYIYIIKGGL